MFHECDNCGAFDHEDDGILYEGYFECGGCYGRRMDSEYAAMQDVAAIMHNYPNLHQYAGAQQSNPDGFYLDCKDRPEALSPPIN